MTPDLTEKITQAIRKDYEYPHLFESRSEICVGCRRPRSEVVFDGPFVCDGNLVWREFLLVASPMPVWQKVPVLSKRKVRK